MAGRPGRREPPPGARLSIGALSRATGIPVETLRTWESRYGFPVPGRKPSGHRVYPVSIIPRLRRIAEALARGHRAGEAVPASEADLAALLQATPPAGALPLERVAAAGEAPALLRVVAAFNTLRLWHLLLADWVRLGLLSFLRERVAPLLRAVGDAWETGRLEIRHEHFLSERVGDLLRSLRLPLEERAAGPLVVFATLPGEEHGLGLQMAALVLASVGCRILYLGTEVPPRQVAALGRDLNARVIALSVSQATRGAATRTQIRRLRGLLPRRIRLLVGGDGAPQRLPGVEVIQDLAVLERWGRELVAGAGSPAA